MGLSDRRSWLAALSCLFCMVGEIWCDCPEVDVQITGGSYTLTKQLETGSNLIYSCPEGYYPYPELKRVCQRGGTWDRAPRKMSNQRCRLVECPDPAVLKEGSVSPSEERYYVGNETTYDCYSGYAFRGSNRRVCLPNGKWSGNTPICSRDSGNNCHDPGIPAGASRTGNIFDIDDKVTYSCDGNQLFLVGSKERVCQENGHWTGIEPACYYKHTFDTPLEVSQAFGSAIKETLTTSQPIGEDTQEGRILRISKNGTLNIYIAVDISESITEPEVNSAKDAVIALIRKIASFTATPNYEVVFFSSEITEVVKILDFMEGKIVLTKAVEAIREFKKEGLDSIGTNLKQVFETFLERMAIIKERVKDEAFKDHRHVLIVFTDGAYNMGGVPTPSVEQIKKMVYMNQAVDTAEQKTNPREEYLDIYIFGIGAVIFDDDLLPLIAGTGGQHFFRMDKIENLQHTFDGIIDQSEVLGLCGLHKEFDPKMKDQKEVKRQIYPWFAFIKITREQKTSNCMGSLVSGEFILTAAHCLPFGVTPNDITVDIDDGMGKVKRVKNFFVHPNYNISAKMEQHVEEFYDYDVALIQLEEGVVISKSVRPICIPCTKETNDALQLVGDSNSCDRQEEILFKDSREGLNFLTKTENLVDEKDVYAKLGPNRENCIKHAVNPNVAVTDNFLCTGGLDGHRDHIACKGDSGGAVFKNYEHRTIQVAVVSWGTKDLCSGGGLVESDATSRDFHINLFKVAPFLKKILGNEDQTDFVPLKFLDLKV